MSKGYLLARDKEETERLVSQHECWKFVTGNQLIPSHVTRALPATASVLDVCTGSAVFLKDLPQEYERIGCDISTDQFPAEHPGIELFEQDVTKPFPSAYHNRFDLVHMRLLVASLTFETWPIAIRHLISAAKPGAYIELAEYNIEMLVPDGNPSEEIKVVNDMMAIVGRIGNKNIYSADAIGDLLVEAGLEDVQTFPYIVKIGKWAIDDGYSELNQARGNMALYQVVERLHALLISINQVDQLDPRIRTAEGFSEMMKTIKEQTQATGGGAKIVIAVGRKKSQ